MDGRLTLVWDNSYSRFRSKTFTYTVTVTDSSAAAALSLASFLHDDTARLVDTPFGPGLVSQHELDAHEASRSSGSGEGTGSGKGKDGEAKAVYVVELCSGARVFASAAAVKFCPMATNEFARANELAQRGLDLFLQNRFVEAEAYFKHARYRKPIFALGFATMAFMKAAMTWEKVHIEAAIERLQQAQKLCSVFMPQTSAWGKLTELIGVSGSAQLTPEQLEATLVFAEATLILAVQHIMEESIMGFVRCGMAAREGWKLYQLCDRALGGKVSAIASDKRVPDLTHFRAGTAPPAEGATRAAAASAGISATLADMTTSHVMGGIEFGLGTFNVVISSLPPLVLRIVQALGFPGDRDRGLAQLSACVEGAGLRSPLGAMTLLVQHVVLPSFFAARSEEHLPYAEPVLEACLARFPKAAELLWLGGRLWRMKADLPRAVKAFETCIDCQDEWIQMKHLGLYELGWCHAFMQNWEACVPTFHRLETENEWSKAFYAYMVAVAHLEMGDLDKAKERLTAVASHKPKMKFGGKVISVEQFVFRRADEFLAAKSRVSQASRLTLPGVEMIYLFNGFAQMPPPKLRHVLAQVDKALVSLSKTGVAGAGVLTKKEAAAAFGPFEGDPEDGGAEAADGAASAAGAGAGAGAESGGDGGAAVDVADVKLRTPFSPAASAPLLEAASRGPAKKRPYDATAICALCRGGALGALGFKDEALAAFKWIEDNADKISNEKFTIPYSLYETGVLMDGDGHAYFKKARDFSPDFNFKIRLAVRVHLATADLRRRFGSSVPAEDEVVDDPDPEVAKAMEAAGMPA